MDKILILGLSKSGIAAAKLAINLGYQVYLSEGKSDIDLKQVQELKNLGIEKITGGVILDLGASYHQLTKAEIEKPIAAARNPDTIIIHTLCSKVFKI